MSTTRYVKPDPVAEKVGWEYSTTLKDKAGQPIPRSSFTTLTLKIYALDAALTDIAGAPTPVDLLSDARGSLHATSGLLTITFTPTDSAMVDASAAEEKHVGLVEGDYATNRKFAREIEWTVRNLAKRS